MKYAARASSTGGGFPETYTIATEILERDFEEFRDLLEVLSGAGEYFSIYGIECWWGDVEEVLDYSCECDGCPGDGILHEWEKLPEDAEVTHSMEYETFVLTHRGDIFFRFYLKGSNTVLETTAINIDELEQMVKEA